jgi:serine protease Do
VKSIGVLISGVAPGTPAEKAGFKSGDVIVEFDGKAVSETGQLRNLVAGTPVGSKVTVTIIRDKKRREITVKLSELTSHALASADDSEMLEQLGFTVQDFSEELADQLGYEGQEGVRKQMV